MLSKTDIQEYRSVLDEIGTDGDNASSFEGAVSHIARALKRHAEFRQELTFDMERAFEALITLRKAWSKMNAVEVEV